MTRSKSGPGQSFRKGITFMEPLQMFPDDATAEAWFVKETLQSPYSLISGF